DTPRRDRRAHGGEIPVESTVVADLEHDPGGRCARHRPVGGGDVRSDRLLGEHVLASVGGCGDLLWMEPGRRAEEERIDIRAAEQVAPVLERLAARLRRELRGRAGERIRDGHEAEPPYAGDKVLGDRKSTRLNSSHVAISYAVFCLKKKKNKDKK